MKKVNILKIIKIVLAVFTAGKAIHDEIKSPNKLSGPPLKNDDSSDNTDPQNPNHPPKKE